MKDDVVKPSLDREQALLNAPAREGEFIKIRPVLEK
jgi:Asp-tRNA(Asn)/Glu-tRNA(Gln) amidotransferase C subunit